MLFVLAVHLAAALGAPALVSALGRRAFLVLALAPASAAVYALVRTGAVADGARPTESVAWVPGLELDLDFRMDSLTWLMLLVVGAVGAIVLIYCSAYFAPTATGMRRFAGCLVGFAGAMAGLVTADNLVLLYVCWELTSVFSYLLIGHYADRKAGRRAAMQAIMVTTAGGLAMLVGLILLGSAAGSYRISDVVADPPGGAVAVPAIVCLLFGAATKSALIPFHFWLPAAMAAPTPVSAYLHAAAMVKAGVYLVARFAPAFGTVPAWRVGVVVLGAGTLLLGGYRALRQYDLKLLLAFGTVSQLGLIVLLVGLGTRAAALAGLALLGAHAMFKAALFLVVGVVDAAAGTRDLRRLSGVGRALPMTAAAGALAVASMIGFPPFAGYVAKESALGALWPTPGAPWDEWVPLAAVVLGSMLTVAYGLRFWWGAFAAKSPAPAPAPAPGAGPHRQSMVLVAPGVVLALLGLAVALVPRVGDDLLAPFAETYPAGESGHLALWAGPGPVPVLTVVILAVGALAFHWRGRVAAFQAARQVGWEADRVYRRLMRGLDEVAADVTGRTQRGSLPLYLGTILVVLVIGPGLGMAVATSWPDRLTWWDRPAQLAAVAAVAAASVLAARARRRLKAVFLVGIAGYANAALFLLHGAPDVALTQVLVETVTLVVMVLVLRRLPPYFSDRPLRASRWVRLAIGVAVGVVAMGFAVTAPSARVAEPVAVDYPREAVAFGGGRNVVNVTLVDIRAWDTMGEIAVLLAAATGVASLIFIRRRAGEILRADDAAGADPTGGGVWGHGVFGAVAGRGAPGRGLDGAVAGRRGRATWLPAGRTLAPERRSVVFEVVTRVIFHPMIVVALYLLIVGHNAPGGGFVAGLLVGLAMTIRYLAGGRYELGEAAPVQPGALLGAGLFLSAGFGLVSLLLTGDALRSAIVDLSVPGLGTWHVATSLVFDVGVFLVVIGLVLDVLRSLGAEVDRHAEVAVREQRRARP